MASKTTKKIWPGSRNTRVRTVLAPVPRRSEPASESRKRPGARSLRFVSPARTYAAVVTSNLVHFRIPAAGRSQWVWNGQHLEHGELEYGWEVEVTDHHGRVYRIACSRFMRAGEPMRHGRLSDLLHDGRVDVWRVLGSKEATVSRLMFRVTVDSGDVILWSNHSPTIRHLFGGKPRRVMLGGFTPYRGDFRQAVRIKYD